MTNTVIHWRCLNPSCSFEFTKNPMTKEEHDKNPWRWCPKCQASSRAIGCTTYECYFTNDHLIPKEVGKFPQFIFRDEVDLND